MKTGLRILMTNNELASHAGSEMFLHDVALGLLRRGHNPVAYSMTLGPFAEELRQKTIPVIDNLNALQETPDVIHGQHHLEAMTAMTHFHETPAIYYCHGWLPWQERPPVFPGIRRYVAVDDLCRERLVTTPGIEPEQVSTLYNFVDLERFQPREPLPAKPESALIFSNKASENNYAQLIRDACARVGIHKVDLMGQDSGNATRQPETRLPEYDIVFAKGRSALEAMAVGCAVIVTESHGVGGLVTSENVAAMRRLNFGVRLMQRSSLTESTLVDALSGYNAPDAEQVSQWIRNDVDLEVYLDKLEAIYQNVIDAASEAPLSVDARMTAVSDYIGTLKQQIQQQGYDELQAYQFQQHFRMLEQQMADLEAQRQDLEAKLQELQTELQTERQARQAALASPPPKKVWWERLFSGGERGSAEESL
ncbi:MAG: glycosyltransferase [Rubinisphaera brasiliensis]|uniref:glycosyltransferase n=1 Tax=Rubinisphaera brasiliensis TaxID=119 RepID=UPI00391DC93D